MHGSRQSVQAGALAAVLASSQASAQALAYYRIPLFLLPIYQAAAAQYGFGTSIAMGLSAYGGQVPLPSTVSRAFMASRSRFPERLRAMDAKLPG